MWTMLLCYALLCAIVVFMNAVCCRPASNENIAHFSTTEKCIRYVLHTNMVYIIFGLLLCFAIMYFWAGGLMQIYLR